MDNYRKQWISFSEPQKIPQIFNVNRNLLANKHITNE